MTNNTFVSALLRYKIQWLSASLVAFVSLFSSCNREESFLEPTRIGEDKITRFEIYPNSLTLNADGTSKLKFLVKCFYKVDSTEVQMLDDRVPVDKIVVTSSDGRSFNVNEAFSTTAKTDSVSFTATCNNLKSAKVSVALRQPQELNLTPLKIPVVFVSLYNEKTKLQMESVTPHLLKQMIEHANQAFAGVNGQAPNGCDAKMEFYMKEYKTIKLSDEEHEEITKYIQKNLLKGADKVVYVWLMNAVPYWKMNETKVHPEYTFGDPKDIPGIEFEKINTLADITNLEPQEAGIPMAFADVFQQGTGYASRDFERMLGRFYGLLPTAINSSLYKGEKDVDYCEDTYSFFKDDGSIEKKSIPLYKNGSSYFFNSYNIMDEHSTNTSVSVDQVKRIRQVIKDCPYRQQHD